MNAPVQAARPPVNKWLVAISVTFGTLMGTIDASIVNVATPHLRGAMGADVQEITWVTTGFVIANVIVMPLTAFFGRFFGQKRVYVASLVLFEVKHFLCDFVLQTAYLYRNKGIYGHRAGFIHAGFPRRCVCGSRLSSARTCQPSRTRRSTTCEPIRPAAPVTSARFIGVEAFVSNAF